MRSVGWVVVAMVAAGLGCASGPEPGVEAASHAATVDGMCAEHGVLEAVCTKCNPSLIPVFQAKGDWCPEHGFPKSFCPVCNPAAGGRPAVDVADDGAPPDGTKIRFRTRETADQAGISVAAVVAATDAGGVETVAHLTWDATRQAVVGARADGVVQAIRADVGAAVRPGDVLAVVQSAGAASDSVVVQSARSRVLLAEQTLDRKRGLDGVVSGSDLARAEAELAAARADLRAVEVASGYALTAPIVGVVTRRDVTLGAAVRGGEAMFEVVDPSRLWAELDVPEAEVSRVKPGQPASIELDGVEGPPREGEVQYVAPSIDPHTRTTLARVALDNADGALRANMYGVGRVAVGGDRAVFLVPAVAVQQARGVDLVFVRTGVDAFETRRVKVVRREGSVAQVIGALEAGQEVATEGSFLLKTEILEDSIGAGCCDVE